MTNTTQYYIQRIDRALIFITQSLSDNHEPKLADIADAACLSKYHFHRIYRLVTGETCQQTIDRIKLAVATNTLAKEGASVMMAAVDANYSSSQALAKALKRATGFTASELKNDSEQLAATIEKLQLPSKSKPGLIAIELTQLSPIKYIAHKTDLPFEELNTIYEQLFMVAGSPENVAAIIGLSPGNQSTLTAPNALFECGLVLQDYKGQEHSLAGGGNFLRVRHNGSYGELDASIDELYRYILTQQDIELLDEQLLFHYLDDPEEVEESALRTDIYLPVSSLL